jgi:hypothetical protein
MDSEIAVRGKRHAEISRRAAFQYAEKGGVGKYLGIVYMDLMVI